MKVKCIIVDDEHLAQDILEEYIKRVDFLQLEAKCRSVVEAMNILNRKKIDLIFLDIQMPEITGLQFLKSFSVNSSIIITTAYSEHAIEGYDLAVLDYLLKPIPFDRFLKAVNRFMQNRLASIPENSSTQREEQPDNSQLFVKSEKHMIGIKPEKILYIESIRNNSVIYLEDSKKVTVLTTLSHLEDKLSKTTFLRIHRSYIISVQHIESFTQNHIQIGAKFLPIGRNYKQSVMAFLNSRII